MAVQQSYHMVLARGLAGCRGRLQSLFLPRSRASRDDGGEVVLRRLKERPDGDASFQAGCGPKVAGTAGEHSGPLQVGPTAHRTNGTTFSDESQSR